MPDICVFGDSIAYGCWDKAGGWVARLRRVLETEKYQCHVYNLGVSGDMTPDLLARFDCEAGAREPDVIIFAVGINDAARKRNGEHRVPMHEFEKNTAALIKAAKHVARRVVVLGITNVDERRTVPVPWDKDASYLNVDISQYDAALSELSGKHKIWYMRPPLLKKSMLNDGLHPNSNGHAVIFKAVLDFLLHRRIVKPV